MQKTLRNTRPHKLSSMLIPILLTGVCLAGQGPPEWRYDRSLGQQSKLLRFSLSRQPAPLVAGNSGVIRLSTEHELRGTLLPAGYYQIRCEHERDRHELVLLKLGRDWSGASERVEGEVARVKCKIKSLGHKAPTTVLSAEQQPSGHLKITEVHIGGENVRHLLD